MTNKERIRKMNDKELAIFLDENIGTCSICSFRTPNGCCGRFSSCIRGIEKWLDSEVI